MAQPVGSAGQNTGGKRSIIPAQAMNAVCNLVLAFNHVVGELAQRVGGTVKTCQ